MAGGRVKKIANPDEMLVHFQNYVDDVKMNPIKVHDFVGKDGRSDYRLKERPVTADGFYVYGKKLGLGFTLRNYFDNHGGNYEEFKDVCAFIKTMIRNEQIEGGMVGIYNNSITARLNGLTEKSEVSVKEMPLFPDVI